MIIAHKQLELQTITTSHLELLRSWRNDGNVNRYLINRQFITEEQQLEWFSLLDFGQCLYFLIVYRAEPIGLVYAHNINQMQKSFEGSIFIGHADYENSFIPVQAILLLQVFFFCHLDYEIAFSKVNRSNSKALELDRKLGFEIIGSENDIVKSQCTKKDFLFHCNQMLTVFLNGGNDVKFGIDRDDEKYSFLKEWIEKNNF